MVRDNIIFLVNTPSSVGCLVYHFYIVVTKFEDFDFTNVFQKGLSQSIQGWNQTVDMGLKHI